MQKKLAIATALLSLIPLSIAYPSWAANVLEQVNQSGILRVAVRQDTIPFGFKNDRGQWMGFSVDLVKRVQAELEAELNKTIEIEWVEVDTQNRFQAIQENQVDLDCGSNSFTWERDEIVDFSISYFSTGTQLLVPQQTKLGNPESLQGKRIGVIENTTNAEIIQKIQPNAEFIWVRDRVQGLQQLEQGNIDALVSDGVLLEALRRTAKDPQAWRVTPSRPYSLESYACILPENNSRWQSMINYSLVKYMQGFLTDKPAEIAIFQRWFGTDGLLPYPRQAVYFHYQETLNSLQWLPENEWE